MSIAVNNPSRAGIDGSSASYWAVNGYTVDAQGNETLKAAPGAGQALYLTFLHINFATDNTIVINEDATVLLGPFTFKAAGSNNMQLRFNNPIKLTDNKALKVDAGSAGAVCVYAEGFTI